MSEKINFKDYNFDNLVEEIETEKKDPSTYEKLFDLVKGNSVKEIINNFFLNAKSVAELFIFIQLYVSIQKNEKLKMLLRMHLAMKEMDLEESNIINSDVENSLFGAYEIGEDPQFEAQMIESFLKNLKDPDDRVSLLEIAKGLQNHPDPLVSNWSIFTTIYLSTLL